MNYAVAYHTDVGIVKKTNQDSMLIEQAVTDAGPVLLTAVCDGMGGLAKGEVASATLVKALSDWFSRELPVLLYGGLDPARLRESWESLIGTVNTKITNYGTEREISLGTTCCVFLAVGESYYIMNVGDSRAYLLSDGLYQLTHDQSYVQREIDLGHLTPEQALTDANRSVLLQCVGASVTVEPDFFVGNLMPGQCVLMCSDGFVHVLAPMELYERLSPAASGSEAQMKENLSYLVELVKARQERDNISALLVRTY